MTIWSPSCVMSLSGLSKLAIFLMATFTSVTAPQKYEKATRNRREALSEARKCTYVCVNSCLEFARPVGRNAGALSRYSPRAFMYSSKLSLEIIFQYPFRSTGMLAVSQLLYSEAGGLLRSDESHRVRKTHSPNASIWTKLDLIRLRAFHFSQVRLPLRPLPTT